MKQGRTGYDPSRKQLADLDRMEEAGVSHVTLSSARDERCSALERELDGRRLSVREARKLVLDRGDEVRRVVFLAVVEF